MELLNFFTWLFDFFKSFVNAIENFLTFKIDLSFIGLQPITFIDIFTTFLTVFLVAIIIGKLRR